MTKRNIRLTGNFSQWNSKSDHQGIKGKIELHLEQIFRTWHLHWPVYISASLHVVQCSYNNIHAGEKGVVVDALGSRTHLVEMSFHLQVGVDIAGRLCSCCTLWFLHQKKKLYIIKDSALERQETRPQKGRDQELFIFSPVYGVVWRETDGWDWTFL